MEKSYAYTWIHDYATFNKLKELGIEPDKILYVKDRPKATWITEDNYDYNLILDNGNMELSDDNIILIENMLESEDNRINVVLYIYINFNKLVISNAFIKDIYPKIKAIDIDTYKYFLYDDRLNTTMNVYYDSDSSNARRYDNCFEMSDNVVDFIESNPVDGNKIINIEFNEFFSSYAIVILENEALALLKKHNLSVVFTFN